MKLLSILLLLLVPIVQAQTIVCTLPKQSLIVNSTYVCDDSSQQPVWTVLYYQDQLQVVLVNPPEGQVGNHIPVRFRKQSTDLSNGYNTLHVWTSRDRTGEWIRLEGDYGPR